MECYVSHSMLTVQVKSHSMVATLISALILSWNGPKAYLENYKPIWQIWLFVPIIWF